MNWEVWDMNSKISFFNKSVIRSDFKRLWWLSVIDALLIFVSFTFVFLINCSHDWMTSEGTSYITSMLYQSSNASLVFACIMPVALAVLLFSYLNSAKAVACVHGLPIKRGTYFASHILSGIVLLLIPVLANALILLLYRFDANVADKFRLSHLAIWAGIYMVYTMLAFGGAAMVTMIAGNNIAAIAFTYIFAFLPTCIEYFVYYFIEHQVYGYNGDMTTYVTKFLYSTPSDLAAHPLNILKYVIFAVCFIVIAYWLYKERNLENNGEVVAFPKLRPIFVYGVALALGAMGYAYINEMWETNSIFALIPFGVIGIFGASMLVKKSLKINVGIKPAVIFCAGVCVLSFLFTFDFTGYERKIPSTDSIESVVFDNYVNNMPVYAYISDGKRVFYTNEKKELTNAQDIDNVKKLHEDKVKNRKVLLDTENSFRFEITYKLKNGKKLSRRYIADYKEDKELLRPIIETDAVRHNYFPILNDDNRTLEYVEVHDCMRNELNSFTEAEVLNRFYEALRYDTAHTSYDSFADRSVSNLCNVRITFTAPAKYEDGTDVSIRDLPRQDETYYVRSDYQKTRELLASLGVDVKRGETADYSTLAETEAIG